jgi:hypothetical protein
MLKFLEQNRERLIREEMNIPEITGIVYLLHFDSPFKHAKHYLGFSRNLRYRLMFHKRGSGANLLKHVNQANIEYFLARTWQGSRNVERKLKKYKNAPELCPVCKLKDKNQTKFYCRQCNHNHYLKSKAGKNHYRYV